VRLSLITVSIKNRIFRAKRQLSLIPLNRTASLLAARSNLTRSWSGGQERRNPLKLKLSIPAVGCSKERANFPHFRNFKTKKQIVLGLWL